jgi:mono/diheme cytochrome c family protein
MRPSLALVALLLSCAFSSACGSGRRSEPLIGPVSLTTPEQRAGELVFFRKCHKCHPMGDAGLGPALNNKPVPDAAIRLQVRTGVGAMPSFNDEQISDQELDALLVYLDTLRAAE